jgi:hypothetical protein
MTNERKSTVAAGNNLGLVSVDEDPGVAQGTAATVAADNPVLHPANGLFVNEFDSSHRRGLYPCVSRLSKTPTRLLRPGENTVTEPLTNLKMHYCLLKPRSTHRLCSRLLV